MALSCVISEIKRDIGQKLIFHTTLHSTPPLRECLSEYCHPVWYGESRMVVLPNKTEDMNNRLDRIPGCDRQTDRRMDRHLVMA